MRYGDLTYDDYLRSLNIQDVLIDAGYHLNRRDGLRYPSYVRTDSEGRRIRGDKFIVTANGQCCFQPPRQKLYNVISFIKEHPQLFAEYRAGLSPDRLVNLVCCRLLHHPVEERAARVVQPKRELKPFEIGDYELHRFDPQERESQKRFYSHFKSRGIDLYTQYAFHRSFYLASKRREDGACYTNLSFPLTLPNGDGKVVGFEERGRPYSDGSSYKGKAEGSNSHEGLWIASPAQTPLSEARHVYWFESAYDAMAYYQLHQKENRELRKAVFVSTGGNPTTEQMRGTLSANPSARQHICFDTDLAGDEFASRLEEEIHKAVRASIEETPERKAYLDTLRDGWDVANGEVEELPREVFSSYCKYESAWEEAMSMQSSGLSAPEDIQDQVKTMNELYSKFRTQLLAFLGLEEKNDTPYVRERPDYPCKDWNEQLLAGRQQEESVSVKPLGETEPEQEQQARFRR